MFSTKTKSTASTAIKAAPRALFQSVRNAAAGRGLQASRGLTVGAPAYSQAAQPSVPAADRIGVAVTLLLSLALMAGGSLMVAQIWANLAMIR
ncbi:MAG TPA: hypothetical protein VNF29_01300 [Candidatus Binataceae bacterium]|nr:hypothetical protein [Candidatus Binataceae bacterium]